MEFMVNCDTQKILKFIYWSSWSAARNLKSREDYHAGIWNLRSGLALSEFRENHTNDLSMQVAIYSSYTADRNADRYQEHKKHAKEGQETLLDTGNQ